MSQKKLKQASKHTVKEVLKSLEWGIDGDKLTLLSPITNEYVSIDMNVLNLKENHDVKIE